MEVITNYTENVFIARFEGISFHSLGPMTAYNWCTGSNFPAEVKTDLGELRLAFYAYLGAPTSARDSRIFVEIAGYSVKRDRADLTAQFIFETIDPPVPSVMPIENNPGTSTYFRHEPYWSQTEPVIFSGNIWERICFPTKRKAAIVMTIPMNQRDLHTLTLKITMRTLIDTRQRSISHLLPLQSVQDNNPVNSTGINRNPFENVRTEGIPTLSDEIANALFDESSCDVAIYCPTTTTINREMSCIPAHSFLLRLRSEVFKTMLLSTSEHAVRSSTHVIRIEDFPEPVVRSMLCFLYTDSLTYPTNASGNTSETSDILQQFHVPLFRIANRFQIRGLQVITSLYMISILSRENAISFLCLADAFRVNSLKDAAIEMIHHDVQGCMEAGGLLENEKMIPNEASFESDSVDRNGASSVSYNSLLRDKLGDRLFDEFLLKQLTTR